LNSALPPLYASWIAELLPGPVPEESRSTCSECAMCSVESPVPFEIKTKCCTYTPSIPNFLAGRILENNVAVFNSYWKRAQIRPQGVWPDQEFAAKYHPASPLFGRNIDWRCPYYLEKEGGLCGIWEQRNARCATWFCKHLRGKISHEFWSSIEALLTSVETSLSLWCIHQLNAGSDDFRKVFPLNTQETSFSDWLQQQFFYQGNGVAPDFIWGKWINREREFFSECSRLVTTLGWHDIGKICGARLDSLQETVMKCYARLTSDFFPAVIKLSDFHQIDTGSDEVRLWTVNPYDPVTLPKTTLRFLHRMNGRRMADVTKIVPGELIVKLFDAGILI
jgi:hypothetical protein